MPLLFSGGMMSAWDQHCNELDKLRMALSRINPDCAGRPLDGARDQAIAIGAPSPVAESVLGLRHIE
jgi:hypothetical protein